MPYQDPTYRGDSDYSIDTTGDACIGDQVRFERATFSGSFRNAKFAGFEIITGEIIKDSYGAAKQQHTFTLELDDGSTIKIKGRNLYKNGTYRKPWTDESFREKVLANKHARGNIARTARTARINDKENYHAF